MNEPLKQFICDTCGGVIEKQEDGWIEWIQHNEGGVQINKDFRICHHVDSCMVLADDIHVSDGHLNTMLVGNSMYLQLLDMLSSPLVPLARPEDIPGIVEMIRRLTIPYYDEARRYLKTNEYSGPYDYFPAQLRAIIEEGEEDQYTD